MNDEARRALEDLNALVEHGPRFHGSRTMDAASQWLETRLSDEGWAMTREPVQLPGWDAGGAHRVAVLEPHPRDLPAWPMLWSGGSHGVREGRLELVGPEGIWGDSIVWQRFLLVAADGTALAYLHARDRGPAAPQPLPGGSDRTLPHLVIGHLDGLQLAEWLADGKEVRMRVETDAGPTPDAAVSDNLIVDIPGRVPGPTVVVCAHYDTFFNTVGAYDNGSGTVALLALARRWSREAPPIPVRLIWFTAEEWHLAGSRHHVARAGEALDEIGYVVNVDGLGRGSFLEAFASPQPFETAIRRAVSAHASRTGREITLVSRFPPTRGTDDASFWACGVPSAFVTFNDLHRLHQPDDVPNEGIAGNVAWVVDLVQRVVEETEPPDRVAAPAFL